MSGSDEKPFLIPDDVAVAAGRGLDPPRTRRPFHSRLATSLVLATLFCAGAALTAGAGNEARMDATPLAEATTTADQADAPAPATDESAPAPAEEPVAAPEPVAEAEPVAAEAPATDAPAAEPDAAAPTPEAPVEQASPDPSDVTQVKATPVVETSAPPAPVSHPRVVAKRTVPHATRTAKARSVHTAPAAPLRIPLRALAFDPQAWLNDNPASPTGASAVALSAQYLGVPYVWGGAAPATGFDCSGLTMFVYDQLGIRLPHYAAAQFAMFPKVDPLDLEPGDLVFFEPKFDGPGHVAVYAGGDRIIEAPHTGAVVRYSTLSGAAGSLGFMGAVRPYGAASDQLLAGAHAMQVSLFARPE
jgi:peptidoglycan DL-endopeptidase CwlO